MVLPAERPREFMMKLFALLAAFLVAGMVIVAILWDAVNDVSAGDLGRLAVALPVAVVFVAFLIVLARQVGRLESRR